MRRACGVTIDSTLNEIYVFVSEINVYLRKNKSFEITPNNLHRNASF